MCVCMWWVRVRTCVYECECDESGEYLISSLDYEEENVIIKETIVRIVDLYPKEVSVHITIQTHSVEHKQWLQQASPVVCYVALATWSSAAPR